MTVSPGVATRVATITERPTNGRINFRTSQPSIERERLAQVLYSVFAIFGIFKNQGLPLEFEAIFA